MPAAPHAAPALPPIPSDDPLFADVLRAALAAYLRGDYLRAGQLWLDAAALIPARPERPAWRFLGDVLQNACELGQLESVDVARDELERRR